MATFTDVHDAHDHTGVPGVGGGGGAVPWYIAPYYGLGHNAHATVGANNRAFYVMVDIPAACTINGVRILVGTQSGNIDVGLFSADGTKVASSGSTACPAAGLATVLFSSPYAAAAGRYLLALSCDNTTATFSHCGSGTVSTPGANRIQNSAFPLPATAAPGSAETAASLNTLNIIGIVDGGFEP